ncbi:helix-turn-helix domain-containing protein [Salinibacter altiplanensis]|uniref:helix-turn-helix domain-containing protein n=1 Tax=Salinibacter altiplanensis TaxID=1803181 RepID=UPI003C6DE517
MTGEELRRKFGRRIRATRRSRDVTQEKLAEYCGLSPEYISHIERGRASPSFDVIAELSEELEVHPQTLFDFTGLEERS